jgi:hypothetical protein
VVGWIKDITLSLERSAFVFFRVFFSFALIKVLFGFLGLSAAENRRN